MSPFIRHSLLFILCLILPSSVFAWPPTLPKKDISLSSYSGSSPLTIRLIGPRELVFSGKGYPEKFVWCGYKVSWGDGADTDFAKEYKQGIHEYCSSGLEHVYKKPGVFLIKVIKFHPGPTDQIIRDWEGRTKVIVKEQEVPLL